MLRYVSHRLKPMNSRYAKRHSRRHRGGARLHRSISGTIGRKAIIRNRSKQAITLESAQSAAWYLPAGVGYRLSYLSGRWAAETQLNREPIHEGIKVLESRTGHTGHNINPWFAIDEGDADETNGRVWFGALAWSGNWRISVEQTPYRQVRVTGGFNPFDFAYRLEPGESLETPLFYAGYSQQGLVRRRACCTIWSAATSSRVASKRGRDRFSTTRGKPPNLTWTKRDR